MSTPDLRVTIRRDGLVRAITWGPWLEVCGPTATLLDARGRAGVMIADVTILREDAEDDDEPGRPVELLVDPLCGGEEHAITALLDWAELVGYERVWLPDGVVTLAPRPSEKLHVRCTGCRGRLVDGTDSFWGFARNLGYFPPSCPLCGADLPQWTPVVPRRPRREGRLSTRPVAENEETCAIHVSDFRNAERQ